MTDHINLSGDHAQRLEKEIVETKLLLLEAMRENSNRTYRDANDAVIAAAYAYSVISGAPTVAPPILTPKTN